MVRLTNFSLIMALRENSRLSVRELARRFGVTDTAIRKRLRKLESEGVITRYTVEVDLRKLGYRVHVLIGLDVRPEKLFETIEVLKSLEEVISLYSSSGDHVLLAECWFRDTEELSEFIKKLNGLEGVVRVCPSIIIEKVK